jgi:hypothetical protein
MAKWPKDCCVDMHVKAMRPPAGIADGVAALLLLGHVSPQGLPRLEAIFADQVSAILPLSAWVARVDAEWRR